MGKHWNLSEEQKRLRSERMRGEGNPMFGRPRSDETKLKISLVRRGLLKSVADSRSGYLRGPDNPCYGVPKTEAAKEKQRASLLGRKPSEEQLVRQRLGLNRPEVKMAISKASKIWWAAAKASGNLPSHLANKSSETRQKISAAAKEQWKRDGTRMRAVLAEGRRKRQADKPTKPERMLFEALEKAGAGGRFQAAYRVKMYVLDLADPARKIGVEVDGCYWHGCPACGYSNAAPAQFNARVARSKTTYLVRRGWRVIRVWEHDLNRACDRVVYELLNA